MLVGRGAQLDLVAEALAAARQCAAPVVLLCGEAGIGKSSVLAAAAVRASAAGFLVLHAHGEPFDRARPFAPLLAALREAGLAAPDAAATTEPAAPHRAIPEGTVPAGPARSSPFETGPEHRALQCDAIVGLIEACCERQPVALLVDDLHWVDAATLVALSLLVRRTAERPLLVWLASRLPGSTPDDLTRFIDTLGRAADRRLLRWQTLELPPLTEVDAAALAAATAGAPPGPRLAALVRRCAGNPLLVSELVGALRDSGGIEVRTGRAELVGGDDDAVDTVPLPAIFHGTIRTRMAQLDGADREVAVVASALGGQFTLVELAEVVGRPVAELLPVAQRLVERRFLVDADGSLQFRHDLVRTAVRDALGPALQAALHRSIADALRRLGEPIARVAEHVALGATPGSLDAVDTLRRAAAEVVRRDPVAAARLLRRAIELCPVHEVARDGLLGELVEALSWSGDSAEAVRLAGPLLARPLPVELERSVRAALGRALLLLGRPTQAVEHERRLVELGDDASSSAWPFALCAVCRIFAMDLDGALGDAERAVAVGRAEGDLMGEILGLCVQSFGRNALGESERAVALAGTAVRLADASPAAEGHRLHPHLFRAIPLLTLGRAEEAAAGVAQGRLLGESIGARWAMGTYHFITALAHWDRGRWDDLLAEVEAGFDVSDEQGTAIAGVWALAVVGRVQLFRGQLEEAAATLDRADAALGGDGVQVGVDWLLHSRALLLEATGRTAEAFELLRFGWQAASDLQARASLLVFGTDLARLAMAAGDAPFAAAVASLLAEIAAATPGDPLSAVRAQLAGAIARSDAPAAIGAAELLDAQQRPFEAAQARVVAAALLAGADRAGAADVVRDALRCFEALDAQHELQRAQALCTAPVAPAVGRRPRAVSGWAALTTTEREVVDEVRQGRSNPEIAARLGISRRTVEAHLRSIFAKLSVSNRLALALAAVQRDPRTS